MRRTTPDLLAYARRAACQPLLTHTQLADYCYTDHYSTDQSQVQHAYWQQENNFNDRDEELKTKTTIW